MQTLEVTDEQYAVIQRLRAAISAEVVGKYGFVRERDAVQFLIDSLEADGDDALDIELDLEDIESGTGATADVAAAVDAAIAGDDGAEIRYDESLEGANASVEEAVDDEVEEAIDGEADDESDDTDETLEDDDVDGESDDEAESGDDETAAEIEPNDDENADEAASADTDDVETEDGDDDTDDGGAADDDDMLNRMMSLLETHDDKWEESPAADYRYRVTLPDESTEDVQTKDDVRALLFKNY